MNWYEACIRHHLLNDPDEATFIRNIREPAEELGFSDDDLDILRGIINNARDRQGKIDGYRFFLSMPR